MHPFPAKTPSRFVNASRWHLRAVLIAICLCSSACVGTRDAHTASSRPADLSVSLGRGGGFSGIWEGVRVEQDGAVIRWTGLGEREDGRRSGTLTESQMADIWRRLNEDDLLKTNLSETGNMTSFIEVTANGATHKISWEVGSETEFDASGAAEKAYRDVMEIVDTVGR